MVVSKRCKICALIDTNNVSITGEYFGKLIPDLVLRICGIEVDPRKANGVLICQLCVIQLVHADMVIDKLRHAVQRFKKNVKEAKPKTPLKVLTAIVKKNTKLNKTIENGVREHNTNECDPQYFLDGAGTKIQNSAKTPKEVARRKSVYREEIYVDNTVDNEKSDNTVNASNNTKLKKFLGDVTSTEKSSVNALKRKNVSVDEIMFSFDNVDATPMKRKSFLESVREERLMNLTVDESDGNKTSATENKVKVKNCILCGKIFNSNSALRSHIETGHMGERLKACPHCSSEFRSRQKYETHVFGEKCKNTIHVCQYLKCDKRFKTLHKMELHMKEKHSSQNESGCE